MKKILVINPGSSTIKWKIYSKDKFEVLAEGVADRITVDGIIETKFNGEKHTKELTLNNHKDACQAVADHLSELKILDDYSDVENIGFRVVQGGTVYSETTELNDKDIKVIDELSILAPLHNPGAVASIKAFKDIFKEAKLTATFDTAFHTTMPEVNYTYPIEKKLAKKLGIKKFGMHGTSHRFVTLKMQEILGKKDVNIVVMHIGNGASLCAVKDSKSIDTSMGLTPLAGVMMGTRSGDIDPSIHSFVVKNSDLTLEQFETILNKESGIKGISGISQDMRDILGEITKGNKDAIFTMDLYTQKIVDYLVNYINKIGPKVDALVFTAGVGENSTLMRAEVLNKLNVVNVNIDKAANESKIGDFGIISTKDSEFPVYVVRTDEELMIAKDAVLK